MSNELKNTDQWLSCIKDAYLSGDLVLTESMLEQAIHETNASPRLLEVAGMIAFKCGDIDKSIQLIEAAMFEASLSISGQLTIANGWLARKQMDQARTTLTFLVEVVDRVPCSMLADLTHALSSLEEYHLAVVVCREAHLRHPEDHQALFGAAFYMHRTDYPLSLVYDTIQMALELKPDSDLYRLNLAVVCCSMNNWDEAYFHARQLSMDALRTVPCECMVRNLRNLFARYEDRGRLEILNDAC